MYQGLRFWVQIALKLTFEWKEKRRKGVMRPKIFKLRCANDLLNYTHAIYTSLNSDLCRVQPVIAPIHNEALQFLFKKPIHGFGARSTMKRNPL